MGDERNEIKKFMTRSSKFGRKDWLGIGFSKIAKK